MMTDGSSSPVDSVSVWSVGMAALGGLVGRFTSFGIGLVRCLCVRRAFSYRYNLLSSWLLYLHMSGEFITPYNASRAAVGCCLEL